MAVQLYCSRCGAQVFEARDGKCWKCNGKFSTSAREQIAEGEFWRRLSGLVILAGIQALLVYDLCHRSLTVVQAAAEVVIICLCLVGLYFVFRDIRTFIRGWRQWWKEAAGLLAAVLAIVLVLYYQFTH